MKKSQLDKKDKNAIFITLVIGFISQFFIEIGVNIAILCFYMYICHKYIGTTENIKEYDSYEFSDRSRFDRGKKLFVWLVDIYIVIRIIVMFLNPQDTYVFGEILLITIIYNPYEMYLNKKYVISTNILEENKIIFARRKTLLTIGMIIFVVLSIGTINTIKKIPTQDSVKYGNYEYSLSNIKGQRQMEIKTGSNYMMTRESDSNSKYFHTFIEKTKSLMKKQVVKSYLFISMVLFFVLCFIEAYPKDQNIISKAFNILLVSALIFSILNFNMDISKEQMDLSSYFHEHMSSW